MTSLLENPLTIVVALLFITTIVLLVLVISMHRKLKSFLVNIDSRNIADSLLSVSTDLKTLQSFKTEIETYLSGVEKRLRKSIQSVHTIRFNPFKGTGGGSNQSFATTLITEEGDGERLAHRGGVGGLEEGEGGAVRGRVEELVLDDQGDQLLEPGVAGGHVAQASRTEEEDLEVV